MPKRMLQCLEEIVKELGALKPEDFLPPRAKPEPGDTVLMEMNDETKRLCSLWNRAADEHNSFIEDALAKGKIPMELSEEEQWRVLYLGDKHDLIEKIMWFSVRKQANLFNKDAGIRSNWMIVIPAPQKEIYPLEKFLDSLDGSGGFSPSPF